MGISLNLSDLIDRAGVNRDTALVMRHTPGGRWGKAAPLIVEAAPEDFALYEREQVNPRVISSFRACDVALSFLGLNDGRTVFSGAFEIGQERIISRCDLKADARWQRLHRDFGLHDDKEPDSDEKISIFSHTPLADWKPFVGRLQIGWTQHIAWCRRGHSSDFRIEAIHEDSVFAPPMPDPERIILRAPELALLPRSWRDRLSQWRGIYLITVESDGARYVGAAYGSENLLGRWRSHVAGESGVTKELMSRPTEKFRFSILELLAPNATMEEVIARERAWMDRLDTIEFGLNS